jgi:hypothetical protein
VDRQPINLTTVIECAPHDTPEINSRWGAFDFRNTSGRYVNVNLTSCHIPIDDGGGAAICALWTAYLSHKCLFFGV